MSDLIAFRSWFAFQLEKLLAIPDTNQSPREKLSQRLLGKTALASLVLLLPFGLILPTAGLPAIFILPFLACSLLTWYLNRIGFSKAARHLGSTFPFTGILVVACLLPKTDYLYPSGRILLTASTSFPLVFLTDREKPTFAIMLTLMLGVILFLPPVASSWPWKTLAVHGDLKYLDASAIFAAFLFILWTFRLSRSEHSRLITHRTNLIRRLSSSRKRIRSLSKQKDRLLSLVAHDLRSPLASHLDYFNYFSEALETKMEQEDRLMGDKLRKSSHLVLDLLDELLHLSS